MLSTNNNQNSIQFSSMTMQQKVQDRKIFEQFLNKNAQVTCDKPKGHLVKENAVQKFAAVIPDTAKDVSNLGRALTSGKSNDFELGRMNDLGMKIGGGLVAAALMGSKATTNKKLMEVFGFGTFFSVMSLWPKVAIDLPTKIMHGFDPHQKYVDSQGRKKQFFQDNQYLPWDVWSDEDINKIADKMGVSKDIKDRRAYTQEKMRTIALQDNTLWMLTAGLATPLITSLACNRIEEGLKVPVANYNLKAVSGKIDNMGKLITDTMNDPKIFNANKARLTELTTALRKGEMPEGIVTTLSEIFDLTCQSDNQLVRERLTRNNSTIAQDLVTRLFPQSRDLAGNGVIERVFAEASDEDVQKIKGIFTEAQKRAAADASLGGKYGSKEITDKVSGVLLEKAKLGEIGKNEPWVKLLREKLKTADWTCYDKNGLMDGAKTLETIYQEGIVPAQAQMRIFGKQLHVLDNVSGEKYNRTARTLINCLGLSDKEITVLRNAHETDPQGLMQEIFAKKISAIASDESKYTEVMQKLAKEEARIEQAKHLGKEGKTSTITGVFEKLTDTVSTTLKDAAKKLSGKTDDVIADSTLMKTLQAGLSEREIAATRTNITSVEAMISRAKSALELEKRIQDGSLMQEWDGALKKFGISGGAEIFNADDKLQFFQDCRRIAWQSTYGDAMNKYHLNGNGTLFTILSDMLFGENNAQYQSNWMQQVRNISNSTEFIPYPDLTIKMSAEELAQRHFEAMKAANPTANESEIKELKKKAEEIIKTYFSEEGKSHELKYADFGESVLGTFKKQVNQMSNDRKWMKVFGGLTVALVGVTLISQLFFGKVKDAHLYEREPKQDTFESGNK